MIGLTRRTFVTLAASGLAANVITRTAAAASAFDVVVYGGTAGGICAAVAAARAGLNAVLVCGPNPLGGMPAQGLSFTDIGNPLVSGGLAHEFFLRVGKAYGLSTVCYNFEPHVALAVFRQMLSEAGVTIVAGGLLSVIAKATGNPRRIAAIQLTDGTVLNLSAYGMMVDASYEGDLMAAAGVAYVVGRESRTEFSESLAGFNVSPEIYNVSPYYPGTTKLLPGVNPFQTTPIGGADKAVPAYTFRLCISNDPSNQIPFSRPPGYNEDYYLIGLSKYSPLAIRAYRNSKADLNGDFYGASWLYPDGDLATRAAIWRRHRTYQAGLLYFLSTSSRVSGQIRDSFSLWGLAADEFVSSDHWPQQLYIREGRRMRGRYIMRQKDVLTDITKQNPIGMGSYDIDLHITQVMELPEHMADYEGTITSRADRTPAKPYQIPYESLVPNEIDNLFVTSCVSATHIAYSSIRLEPQYMIMGQAAGVGAALAIKHKSAAIDVASAVPAQLKSLGAVLEI